VPYTAKHHCFLHTKFAENKGSSLHTHMEMLASHRALSSPCLFGNYSDTLEMQASLDLNLQALTYNLTLAVRSRNCIGIPTVGPCGLKRYIEQLILVKRYNSLRADKACVLGLYNIQSINREFK